MYEQRKLAAAKARELNSDMNSQEFNLNGRHGAYDNRSGYTGANGQLQGCAADDMLQSGSRSLQDTAWSHNLSDPLNRGNK